VNTKTFVLRAAAFGAAGALRAEESGIEIVRGLVRCGEAVAAAAALAATLPFS